jgi:hypothetical protein
LERIIKCKPKFYKRKYYDTDKDGKDTTPVPQSVKDTICIGLLAQDVLETNPHCVSGWKNDNIKETDDDDGTRYGINYGDFTVHLIGAVQEIVKQSTSQATLVQELKKQNERQQKEIDLLLHEVKQGQDAQRAYDELLAYKKLSEERFDKLGSLIEQLMNERLAKK